MNCPFCKSTRVAAYANEDLLLVIAGLPEVSKLMGFRCNNPKCNGTFYALEELINKGLQNQVEGG